MKLSLILTPAVIAIALAACAPQTKTPDETDASVEPEPEAQATEGVSILRPDIVPPEPEASEVPLESLLVVIGFPDGGSALGADAIAALEEVVASKQLALGGLITLGAHSDSGGSDERNLDASEARGLAVAGWLIDQGVAAERITVIAFGEQNPAEPNALSDGSPNEAGRAANRRVEVLISVTSATSEPTPVVQSVEARD